MPLGDEGYLPAAGNTSKDVRASVAIGLTGVLRPGLGCDGLLSIAKVLIVLDGSIGTERAATGRFVALELKAAVEEKALER